MSETCICSWNIFTGCVTVNLYTMSSVQSATGSDVPVRSGQMSRRYCRTSMCLRKSSASCPVVLFNDGHNNTGPKHTATFCVVILFVFAFTATRFRWSSNSSIVTWRNTGMSSQHRHVKSTQACQVNTGMSSQHRHVKSTQAW